MKYTWLIIIIVLLVLVMYLVLPKNPTNAEGLPNYALKNERIKEAYLFAKENPLALKGINCYCGCMRHPHGGRIHTNGLHDCFINGDKFEIHGSQCDMCVNDALKVKYSLTQGKTKEE